MVRNCDHEKNLWIEKLTKMSVMLRYEANFFFRSNFCTFISFPAFFCVFFIIAACFSSLFAKCYFVSVNRVCIIGLDH